MDSNDNQNASGGDIAKRMEALRLLTEEAEATAQALIRELTEKDARLAKQIEELNAERADIGLKLSCLRGELEEAVPGPFRSRGHRVPDEAIMALILTSPTPTTTGHVQEYFAFSSATVCRRMEALLAAGKVTMEKRGTTKIWKAKA